MNYIYFCRDLLQLIRTNKTSYLMAEVYCMVSIGATSHTNTFSGNNQIFLESEWSKVGFLSSRALATRYLITICRFFKSCFSNGWYHSTRIFTSQDYCVCMQENILNCMLILKASC